MQPLASRATLEVGPEIESSQHQEVHLANFAPLTALQGNTIGASPLALPQFGAGAALNRLNPVMGMAGGTASDPMFQMLQMQDQMLGSMISMLLQLMHTEESGPERLLFWYRSGPRKAAEIGAPVLDSYHRACE